MPYVPTHCKRWKLPRSYMGASWTEYYAFLGQHRDSDAIYRSNFTVALAALRALPEFDGSDDGSRIIVRETHWAVGWVEWIAIHETDEAWLRAADEMLACIENYLLLDEMHYSELEWNEACEYWQRMSVSNRVEVCQECGITPFAARHDYLPADDDGRLFDYLRSA